MKAYTRPDLDNDELLVPLKGGGTLPCNSSLRYLIVDTGDDLDDEEFNLCLIVNGKQEVAMSIDFDFEE